MSARNVEQEFDALKLDLGKLSSDLASVTEALHDLAGRSAGEYGAKLRGVMEHATENVETAAAALKERGCRGAASVVHHMRERPLATILIGFGLGVVIGKLMDR